MFIITQWQWLISSHRNQTVFLLFEDHRGQEADQTVKIVMWSHRILQFYFSRHISINTYLDHLQCRSVKLNLIAFRLLLELFPHCHEKIFLSGSIIFIFVGKPCNLTPDGNWVKKGSQRSKILWFSWVASKNMSHIWWKFIFPVNTHFLSVFIEKNTASYLRKYC